MNLSNFQKREIYKKKSQIALLVGWLVIIPQGNSHAATSIDHYKLYLHSKLISEKQYKCADYVAHIESRWSDKATNNGHYGIFQMRNEKVKYLNAYQQIDMWLKYVAHRYDNKPCKAKYHLQIRNWQ